MRRLHLTDFALYRSISAIKISPDETKVAFVVKQADLERNDYASTLFVCDLVTGAVVQPAASRQVIGFDWLGDSQRISFAEWGAPNTSSPFTRVYETGLDGKTMREPFTVPGWAISMRWLDEHQLVYATKVDLAGGLPVGDDLPDVLVADEVPFLRDGEGFTNKQRMHLYRYDVKQQTSKDLTPGFIDVEGFDLYGDRIVLTANVFEHVAPIRNDVFLLDLADRKLECLTHQTMLFEAVRFLSEDVIVTLASDIERFGSRQNKEVFAIRMSSRQMENLTPGWDRSVRRGVVISDTRLGIPGFSRVAEDGAKAVAARGVYYFVTTEGYASYLNGVDLSGKVTCVIAEPGSVDDFDVTRDTIAYVAMRNHQLQELFILQDGVEKQLTTLNVDALADKTLSIPQHFRVPMKDGTGQVDAWVIKPVGYEAGVRYPAVLYVHGGPKATSSDLYHHELQTLANEGYAILYCNPRGSDGRGDRFHGDIRGNFGVLDFDDIMAVTDHALHHYDFIDAEHIGVTGGSYGGYLTNWIIGHTDRFKAAVSVVGIADLISQYGTTEIGYYWVEDYMTVGLWENMEKWWFHSPLRYADQVKTPTLFLNSELCFQCGLPQGMEFFTALKQFGVDTRLCIFRNEAHGFSSNGKPRARIRFYEEMLSWFNKYLKQGG